MLPPMMPVASQIYGNEPKLSNSSILETIGFFLTMYDSYAITIMDGAVDAPVLRSGLLIPIKTGPKSTFVCDSLQGRTKNC